MGLILNDLKNACELEHVCDYVNNRTTSSMNYISTENMLPNKGGISESTIIPPGTTTEYKIGDILISNIRPYFQKIWCADRCGGCSADVLCIRAKENTDSKYLYYLLSQQAFFDYVMSGAKGCKMPRGDKKQIMQWPVNIPAIDVQKKVVAILSSLDNKIRLNRRINDNLEAMAKQLYDYWFVQFDFPNEEGKPYKSSGGAMVWNEKLKREIPEGWNVANVFDELSVQYGFPFSTELFTEGPTSIPVVRIRDILENSVSAYSEEEVDEKYKLQKQDLLVGMDGNFHMNYWNDNVSYLNQRSVRLRAKSKSTVSIMQAKYDIAPYIKAKELRAKGSTVGHLSDKDLKELFVLVCPNIDFRNKFDSILAEIIENRCEMIELTKQRDELLPLLMNGQASVNYHLSKLLL